MQTEGNQSLKKSNSNLKIVSLPNFLLRSSGTNAKNIVILGFFHHSMTSHCALKLGSFWRWKERGGRRRRRRRKRRRKSVGCVRDGTSLAFPVLHTYKLIHETAFSRDKNSIITVIVVALIIQPFEFQPPFYSGELSVGWVVDWYGPFLWVGPSQGAHLLCVGLLGCQQPHCIPLCIGLQMWVSWMHSVSYGRIPKWGLLLEKSNEWVKRRWRNPTFPCTSNPPNPLFLVWLVGQVFPTLSYGNIVFGRNIDFMVFNGLFDHIFLYMFLKG